MRKGLKTGFILFVIVTVGFISLCVWGYQMVMRSLPRTKGEIFLRGLQNEIRIYRDEYNIPHIIAQNEHDLFFAQGFITAQDRLWQMDLERRIAEGRLTKIVGKPGLKTDSLMLTIGINRTAARIVQHLSPESRRAYQAYADGINSYIKENSKHLPIEFRLLNYKPSPWRIVDTVSILRWFGWQLSFGWLTNATMGMIVEKVGMEKAKELFPSSNHRSSKIVPWGNQHLSALFQNAISFGQNTKLTESERGSNSWVVSGKLSTTGKPILANDPHLYLMTPSIWYETHLIGGGFNVSGVSLPGVPFIVIGHNEKIAWGLTSLMADNMDFFIEKLDPEDSTKVLYNGSYKKVDIIEEKIPRRNKPPIRIHIFRTQHGPIVSKLLRWKGPTHVALSVQWAGYEISDEGLALYNLNRAGDWQSFKKALKDLDVPPLNIVYADVDGNIGVQAAGKIPIRAYGLAFLPRPGEKKTADWKGYIPYNFLPFTKNPEKGFIATANNSVENNSSPYPISGLWDHPSRIQRINQLLSEKKKFSVMDFKRIQTDVFSPFAKDCLKHILPLLNQTSFGDSIENNLVKKLSEWNYQMKTGSSEAVLFEILIKKLMANIFKDEMGDSLYSDYLKFPPLPLRALTQIIGEEKSAWFDNVTTKNIVETKKEIVIKSYHQAVAFLRKRFGDDVSKWSWGELHRLTFKHPLGKYPFVGRTFNLGPFPVDGSSTTVNCMMSRLGKNFNVMFGPSARLIFDLANLDNSISVIPTGESGQPLDEHYRDQLQLYLGNLYHSALFDTTKIIQADWDLLKLQPGKTND